MSMTKGRIAREGRVTFGDASVNVWEEGIPRDWNARKPWERAFKNQVFARIVQTLNRIGWNVGPWDEAEQYKAIALDHRTCRKGDLHGQLRLSGRCISFDMWQDVANITHRNGGRYEHNKEEAMPYLLRLEMERTRRKIRTYLCNVFTGYAFDESVSDGRMAKRGPNGITAMEFIEGCYRTSWHFKGDLTKYEITDNNRRTGDNNRLEHGQRVWFADSKGRNCTGIAYYNCNNMWWVVSGKYAVTNMACFELYTAPPENVRQKRNEQLRRARLENELARAIDRMDFDRAKLIKGILFGDSPLVLIYSKKNEAYYRSNYRGYTTDRIHAGKYRREEVERSGCMGEVARGDLVLEAVA